MNEEVVAKKANLLPGYIFCIVAGLAMLIGCVVAGIVMNEKGAIVIGVLVGLILIACGAYYTFMFIRTPKNFIVYKNEKLCFADGTECYPHEVEHILLKLRRTNGIVSTTGGIVLTVNGRKIEYKNVSNVKKAEARLSELYEYSRNKVLNG